MEFRPATIEEMKAAKPAGEKISFEHSIYETARRNPRTGNYIIVQRSKTRARVQYDEKGAFVMRKDQREDLKADYVTCEGCKPFVALWRATYLK
jgi:hypothetical protein